MRVSSLSVLKFGVAGLLLTAASESRAEPATVSVGAARIDITPAYPVRLTGYESRKTESEGVEQRIWAKALAIGDDSSPSILVTVENCGVPGRVTEEVAARLLKSAKVPRERFVIAATHTHSAPSLGGTLPIIFGGEISEDQSKRIERYTGELTDAIEKVALAALADRRPGSLSWGQGAVGFAANRRVLRDGKWTGFGVTPKGPVDHALPLLRVVDADGALRAVLVNYACHCTTLGGDFNKICGDWAGYAQEELERAHPGVVALISIGCGADANPAPREHLRDAVEHGKTVAREVERLLSTKLTPLPPTIAARLERIDLPFDAPPTREQFTARAKLAGAQGYHARIQLARLDRGEKLQTTLSYPVQTWCFGDRLAMVFLAGEVVVDYSLRLKNELDAKRLWISAYCNDVPCYIASKRVIKEGGYEVDSSMIYYDRPTRLAPEVEDLIVGSVHKLLPKWFSEEIKP